jgi:hypothetical protein
VISNAISLEADLKLITLLPMAYNRSILAIRTPFYLFFTLFFLSANSQERKRIITDQETNKPVSYATIKVLHTTKGQIASVNGEFTIDIKTNDSVLITCVGYHDRLLAGNEIIDKITLLPKPKLLDNVIVSSKKILEKYIIGNGADLVDKMIKCKSGNKADNDCLRWRSGDGAEFAELMVLPDSLKTYRVTKIYIPIVKNACWQPIFLQVYEPDSATGVPGNLIFKKYISIQSDDYKKGKLVIDVTNDNIYISKLSHFFTSISWPAQSMDENCITALLLFKSEKDACYSRNLHSTDYKWFLFYGTTQTQTVFHVSTLFAAEIEALQD